MSPPAFPCPSSHLGGRPCRPTSGPLPGERAASADAGPAPASRPGLGLLVRLKRQRLPVRLQRARPRHPLPVPWLLGPSVRAVRGQTPWPLPIHRLWHCARRAGRSAKAGHHRPRVRPRAAASGPRRQARALCPPHLPPAQGLSPRRTSRPSAHRGGLSRGGSVGSMAPDQAGLSRVPGGRVRRARPWARRRAAARRKPALKRSRRPGHRPARRLIHRPARHYRRRSRAPVWHPAPIDRHRPDRRARGRHRAPDRSPPPQPLARTARCGRRSGQRGRGMETRPRGITMTSAICPPTIREAGYRFFTAIWSDRRK